MLRPSVRNNGTSVLLDWRYMILYSVQWGSVVASVSSKLTIYISQTNHDNRGDVLTFSEAAMVGESWMCWLGVAGSHLALWYSMGWVAVLSK